MTVAVAPPSSAIPGLAMSHPQTQLHEAVLRESSSNSNAALPVIRYTEYGQVKKGEDFVLTSPDCRHGAVSFGVYGVFDGHNGTAAPIFSKEKLMNFVLEQVPATLNEDQFLDALPRALAEGFLKCHNTFAMTGVTSGTTATVAIVTGWTVTVAGVGDSRAILDTVAGGIIDLTIDHRFEDNMEEQRRVLKEGGQLSRLRTFEGEELGPIRSWPGGLCVSRSIGDVDCGPLITPLPHVKQIRVPSGTGGRIILGSDGLWDAVTSERAAKCVKGVPHTLAAAALVKESVRSRGLRDDTTVLVVDLLPTQLAQTGPAACPVPKAPSSTKSFLKRIKTFSKKKEPEPEPEPTLASGDRLPSMMNDQDSMHGSDLYEMYKNTSLHAGNEGNFCAICGYQIDSKYKSDISVRAGNLLCPKHKTVAAQLTVSS